MKKFRLLKQYVIVFILLLSVTGNSQVLSGIVTDSTTKLPIHLANVTFIEKDKGTYTTQDGKFDLKVDNENQILISSIGYESQILDISQIKDFKQILSVRLIPSTEKLTEVFITAKKSKYTSSRTLGKPKKLKVRTTLPFGYEFASLIKNSKNKKGIVEEVVLNLNKSKDYDYLATYNIKFYEYNPITKQPDQWVYHENLIVRPENKTYKLVIDLTDLNISFPENGICVGVEIVNDKYKEPINSMAIIAPKINFTHTDLEVLTWNRYRNKDWKLGTKKSKVRNDYINGLIQIKVKFEK